MKADSLTPPRARFLRACRRLPVDRTPVWFMRQAGRYLPEYRALRRRYSLLELCRQPDLAVEVTLQPVRRLGVDAAILFADILLPLIPMGADLAFHPGRGPVINNPLREEADLARLRPVQVEEDLGYVLETVRLLRRELPAEVPLIGFAGAPFTVASYLIEGGSSRYFLHTKQMLYRRPDLWRRLMGRLVPVLTEYLVAQAEAGAQALQIFDSWAGALSPQDYRAYVLPYLRPMIARVRETGVPVILFGTVTATLLEAMAEAGADVIGVDWRVPLDVAWERLGPDLALQGNLDPAALFAPPEELARRVEDVLRRAGGRPGHIFNLGHGVLPQTPVEALQQVVDLVRRDAIVPISPGDGGPA